MVFDEATRERFWSKVDKRGPDECWLWKGSKYPGGYGQFSIKHKNNRAHRIAKMMCSDETPGPCACHSCDVQACVNPNHIWWGTHAENTADMFKKGRQDHSNAARGERAGKAKLLESQVAYIRLLGQHGYGARRIGKWYGIAKSQASRILAGEHWPDVAPAELNYVEVQKNHLQARPVLPSPKGQLPGVVSLLERRPCD